MENLPFIGLQAENNNRTQVMNKNNQYDYKIPDTGVNYLILNAISDNEVC